MPLLLALHLLACATHPPLSAVLSPSNAWGCYQRKLLIMINHVSEIKAINLPVVTGSRERASLRLSARVVVQRVSVLPAKTEGWLSQLVGPANRPFKTYVGHVREISRLLRCNDTRLSYILVSVSSTLLYKRLSISHLILIKINYGFLRFEVNTHSDKSGESLIREKNKAQESRHEVAREWTRVVTLLSLHRGEANWAELMNGFDKVTIKPGKPHYRTSYEVQDKRKEKKKRKKRETHQMKSWWPCSSIIRSTTEGRKSLFFHLHDAP